MVSLMVRRRKLSQKLLWPYPVIRKMEIYAAIKQIVGECFVFFRKAVDTVNSFCALRGILYGDGGNSKYKILRVLESNNSHFLFIHEYIVSRRSYSVVIFHGARCLRIGKYMKDQKNAYSEILIHQSRFSFYSEVAFFRVIFFLKDQISIIE